MSNVHRYGNTGKTASELIIKKIVTSNLLIISCGNFTISDPCLIYKIFKRHQFPERISSTAL